MNGEFQDAAPESPAEPASGEKSDTGLEIPQASSSAGGLTATAPLSERWLRIFELSLVCSIAFGGSLLYSIGMIFGATADFSGGGTVRWLYLGVLETSALALVWYILRRRSVSFKALGFSWTKRDVGWSIPLWLVGMTGFWVAYYALYRAGFVSATGTKETSRVATLLFGSKVTWLMIALQFLNPFFEELIARAYVMTEVKQLTSSSPAAVLVSTMLQVGYHLYQGAPLAIGEGALFLIFALFYAKTNRITPVILAHLYLDVLSTLRIFVAQG